MQWLFDFVGSEAYWIIWFVLTGCCAFCGVMAGIFSQDEDESDPEFLARASLILLFVVPVVGLIWFIIVPLALICGALYLVWRVITTANLRGVAHKKGEQEWIG